MTSYARTSASAYRSVAAQGTVDSADPHRLVLLLIDAAIERAAAARTSLQHNAIAAKAGHLHRAVNIIDELRDSLDLRAGGEIAANLNELYDYMRRQLLRANLENRADLMSEVAGLLQSLRGGWAAIAPAVNPGAAPLASVG